MAFGLFFGVMDFGGTGVTVPTIADDMNLALGNASLIMILAALTVSALLLPVGGLSDLVGRKPSFMIGGALFTIGSVLASLAPEIVTLLASRVVMATGAAIVMANGMAITAEVFPDPERGMGMGLIATSVGLAAISGPIVAGTMTDLFGWRYFFAFLAGGSLFALFWAWRVLDNDLGGRKTGARGYRAYDWWGAFVSAIGLTVLIVTVARLTELPLAVMIGGFVLSGVFLIMFITRERMAANPMFNLSAFRSGQFSWAISTRFLGFIGTSAWFFLMPFYLQDVLGYAPKEIGLITFPGALGFAMFGLISGRLSDKYGVKPFTVTGMGFVVVGGLMMASLSEVSTPTSIMPALFVNGFGMGLWVAPNMSVAMGAVRSDTYGVITAFINLVRNTASVIGVALSTAIVVGVMSFKGFDADLGTLGESGSEEMRLAFIQGMKITYVVVASVAAAAMIAAARTRDPVKHRAIRRTSQSDEITRITEND